MSFGSAGYQTQTTIHLHSNPSVTVIPYVGTLQGLGHGGLPALSCLAEG